jgi:hypothetical protein
VAVVGGAIENQNNNSPTTIAPSTGTNMPITAISTSSNISSTKNIVTGSQAQTITTPTIQATSSGLLGNQNSGNPPSSGSFALAPSSQVLDVMDATQPYYVALSYPEAGLIESVLPNSIDYCQIAPTTPMIKYFLNHTTWVKITATYSPHLNDPRQDWPDEHMEITSDVPFSQWFTAYVNNKASAYPADEQAGYKISMQTAATCLSDPSQSAYFFDGVRTNTVKFTAISSKPSLKMINPINATVGSQITISGSGFAIDSSNYITIGDVAGINIKLDALSPDGQTLSFILPPSVASTWVLPATLSIEVNNVRGFSNSINLAVQ